MKYGGCLLSVKDINVATAFYQDLFGLRVLFDYGKCIGFDCGLNLQEDFAWLTGIPTEEIKENENCFEVYFEAEDFDGFVAALLGRADVWLRHDVRTHGWGQRVIRFYDPDNHLIEVGECMGSVARRFLAEGLTHEAVATRMDVSLEEVHRLLAGD